MIYISLAESTTVKVGDVVTVGRVARVRDGLGREAAIAALPLKLGASAEVQAVDALDVIDVIRQAFPDEAIISVGEPRAWVEREESAKPAPRWRQWLAVGLASVTLMCGAGMAITYFHADVDMLGAQRTLIEAISPGADSRWMSIPYSIGVCVGVLAFFRLLGGKMPSPLELKLSAWKDQVDEFHHKKAIRSRNSE